MLHLIRMNEQTLLAVDLLNRLGVGLEGYFEYVVGVEAEGGEDAGYFEVLPEGGDGLGWGWGLRLG